MKNLKIILPIIILFVLGYFLWKGLSIDPSLLPSALIDKKTPEFNLESLQDPKIKLSNKIFLGHVSLLNVWASWCSTCAAEYPFLMDIHDNNHIPIYGLDYKDSRNAALTWIKEHGNPFQEVGFDSTGSAAINWGVYGTPETFVIDKNGIIRFKVIGELTPNVWKEKILPLINQLNKEK